MSGNLTPVWILTGCVLALGFVLGRAFTGWQCNRGLAARIRTQLDDMRALGREEGYEEGLCDGRGDPGGTGDPGEWSAEELREMAAEHHVPPHEPLASTIEPPPEHWASGRCWCGEFHRDQVTTLALAEPPQHHQYLTDTSERLEPAWRAEIASALSWWEELPSGTGFTRAMAARMRELTP